MKKTHIKEIVFDILNVYQIKYRHPDLEKLILNPLYDLFPEKEDVEVIANKLSWPETWPSCSESGVYIFLNDKLEVLYIGEAKTLGARLCVYCRLGKDGACVITHSGWSEMPRYIMVISAPKESWFEYSALEKYLINKFPTVDNRIRYT